jgi:processive 1,2-diacylglycerol beta-glucosyltransferase
VRILIIYASVGGGHASAAEAIEQAIKITSPTAIIKNVDILSFAKTPSLYKNGYACLVNYFPHFLGYLYDFCDKRKYGDYIRMCFDKFNMSKFIEFINNTHWNLIINTHFISAEIIAYLRRNDKISIPQTIVTTDFDTHRLWVNEPCEHYFTATEEGNLYLQHHGVSSSYCTTTGIPINPVFEEVKDKNVCLKKYKFSNSTPTVLQLSGGFGIGPIEDCFRNLLKVSFALQIVTVTGRNLLVANKLRQIKIPSRHDVRILGFSKEIDELMTIADLIVSKPGGLTSSEALAKGVPMAIISPIPGQEDRNSDFLLENGAAVKINNIATLAYKIEDTIKTKLDVLRSNASKLGKPKAAFDIVDYCLKRFS